MENYAATPRRITGNYEKLLEFILGPTGTHCVSEALFIDSTVAFKPEEPLRFGIGDFMRFLTVQTDHDTTYGKK